jgi:hypothetical protein
MYVPPEGPGNFRALVDVISQKLALLILAALRNSNPTWVIVTLSGPFLIIFLLFRIVYLQTYRGLVTESTIFVKRNFSGNYITCCRSQSPRGLRHELFSPAWTLGSWVRIPLKAWMFVYVYSMFVLSCVGSGLATVWFPFQVVLPTVYKIKRLKWNEAFHEWPVLNE